MSTLLVFKGDRDISDELKLVNGKSNPFGWSTIDLEFQGEIIGNIYCGSPKNFKEGYSFKIIKESK